MGLLWAVHVALDESLLLRPARKRLLFASASQVEGLWRSLFEEGYGLDLRSKSDSLCAPLHTLLASMATEAAVLSPGQRPCITGVALELAKALMDACTPQGEHSNKGVKALLEVSGSRSTVAACPLPALPVVL